MNAVSTDDSLKVDPRTGRPFGDHGTSQDAIDFSLCSFDPDMMGQEREFLEAWRDGAAFEEWPLYYDWLMENDR